MTNLQLLLRELPQSEGEDYAGFQMRVGNVSLTRLLRSGAHTEEEDLRIPVAPLAYWFADNWWRIRWESRSAKPSESWRMSHEMMAIGHGHAWPKVTIWGDRDRVMLVARADPPGIVGPVRFLTNAVLFTSAADFEAAVDSLFAQTYSILTEDHRKPFQALTGTLADERRNADIARWRRLEAVSGYDADEAPDTLIQDLIRLEESYAPADIEEAAAAAPGPDAAHILKEAVQAATQGAAVDFSGVLKATRHATRQSDWLQPWIVAERAARAVRDQIGRPTSPLLNKWLGELAGLSPRHFSDRPEVHKAPYALRLSGEADHATVLLTARWSSDRRFQLARAIGDAVWSNDSALGAISGLGSARQKFQRSFAAALLCPMEGLLEFFGTANPNDADIAAAAQRFHVNEKTVRTVLVNKHLMERRRLGQPLSDPLDASRLDEVADAA